MFIRGHSLIRISIYKLEPSTLIKDYSNEIQVSQGDHSFIKIISILQNHYLLDLLHDPYDLYDLYDLHDLNDVFTFLHDRND